MKLKARLFVWVGALFFIAFIFSYFLEGYLVRTNLRRSEDNIRDQILHLNEVKRQNIEQYLGISLAEIEARLDSLLHKLAEYPVIRDGFSPNKSNSEYGTWLHSATLMVNNKWIDLTQNMIDDELASLIIADSQTSTGVKIEMIDEALGLAIVTEEGKGDKGPFFALRFYVDQFILNRPTLLDMKLEDQLPPMWLLFTPKVVKNFPIDETFPILDDDNAPLIPFWHWPGVPTREALFKEFIGSMKQAQEFLARNPSMTQESVTWQKRIAKRSNRKAKTRPPYANIAPTHKTRYNYRSRMDESVYERFMTISDRIDDLGLIWGLSAVYSMGPFGFGPYGPKAPIGIARTLAGENQGKSLMARESFFDTPLFTKFNCDDQYAEDLKLCLGESMSTIPVPELDRFFFGNTLRLLNYRNPQSDERGYLTIGKDGSKLLENLALATHQLAVFISGDRILEVYSPDGKRITQGEWLSLPVAGIIDRPSGLIKVGGQEYFFLHMVPFKNADFHFYIFNTKAKEFALVDSLDKNANELITTISFNMRLIALGALLFVLIFLNNVASRITRPISILAQAAEKVGRGELDGIKLPELKKSRRDEVVQLTQSFHDMVEGLKEKERVRGVLNKVVSDEIAEEILNGNIHLGGEEKIVTVLFADIRHFTQLTEKMPPQDVVAMLNTCMTRISKSIDEQGGVIDKYVGDEVMALFGAPVEKADSPCQAIRSALSIIEALEEWNRERAGQGLDPIKMGIGIHTGKVLAGNMGAENRLNYTVLGANVNLASRLCSAAGEMEVLISRATYDLPEVKQKFTVEEKTPIELKGFTEPITVYRVVGINP